LFVSSKLSIGSSLRGCVRIIGFFELIGEEPAVPSEVSY